MQTVHCKKKRIMDIRFLLRHNNRTFYSPITTVIKLIVLTWRFQYHFLTRWSRTCSSIRSDRYGVSGANFKIVQDNIRVCWIYTSVAVSGSSWPRSHPHIYFIQDNFSITLFSWYRCPRNVVCGFIHLGGDDVTWTNTGC